MKNELDMTFFNVFLKGKVGTGITKKVFGRILSQSVCRDFRPGDKTEMLWEGNADLIRKIMPFTNSQLLRANIGKKVESPKVFFAETK